MSLSKFVQPLLDRLYQTDHRGHRQGISPYLHKTIPSHQLAQSTTNLHTPTPTPSLPRPQPDTVNMDTVNHTVAVAVAAMNT